MKKIVEFFEKCPCFEGKRVCEDFLAPKSGSVAIAYDGGATSVKVYASGDSLEQICFKLMLREAFAGQAGKLFDTLRQWLAEGKEKLPEIPGKGRVQYIEIADGPALIKTEVGAGIYEMKFRLVYYRKGAGNE